MSLRRAATAALLPGALLAGCDTLRPGQVRPLNAAAVSGGAPALPCGLRASVERFAEARVWISFENQGADTLRVHPDSATFTARDFAWNTFSVEKSPADPASSRWKDTPPIRRGDRIHLAPKETLTFGFRSMDTSFTLHGEQVFVASSGPCPLHLQVRTPKGR